MKEFEVQIRVRNNLLIQRREAMGFTSALDVARAMGMSPNDLYAYENLRRSPLRRHYAACTEDNPEGLTGDWKPTALRIASFYGVPPEDLWPDVVIGVEKSFVVKKFSSEEMSTMTLGGSTRYAALPPCTFLEERETTETIDEVLQTLTAREELVIREVYGLGDCEPKTLDEIGRGLTEYRDYGVTPYRVGQIRDRALRKLRHSSRSNPILEAMGIRDAEDEDEERVDG